VELCITDEKLVQKIEHIARRERCTEEQLVARVLDLYEEKGLAAGGASFLLAISGLGSSGEEDVSERDEEVLATEVDSVRGWRLERDKP
jgi:predicted DNA-binding ribbon-helix-helix protein